MHSWLTDRVPRPWNIERSASDIKRTIAPPITTAPALSNLAPSPTLVQTGKVPPCSLSSVGPGADPGVQAVSPTVALSHPPDRRLPLLSARPAVTFPAEERYHPSVSTKLYCLVTEAHGCEQLAQGCYSTAWRPRLDLVTTESPVRCLSHALDYRVTLLGGGPYSNNKP